MKSKKRKEGPFDPKLIPFFFFILSELGVLPRVAFFKGECHFLNEKNNSKINHDPVNHPGHYTSNPSGVECIQVAEHFNFNLGNVIKYVWRSGQKGDALEDLKKARWYLNREIARLDPVVRPVIVERGKSGWKVRK